MKSPLVLLIKILICSIFIPVLISIISYKDIDATNQENIEYSFNLNKSQVNYETVDKQSPVITIYNTKLGKNQDMDIEEYLYGVLAGEMPSDFDIEALKAQAVAARTFVMYKQNQGVSTLCSRSHTLSDAQGCVCCNPP